MTTPTIDPSSESEFATALAEHRRENLEPGTEEYAVASAIIEGAEAKPIRALVRCARFDREKMEGLGVAENVEHALAARQLCEAIRVEWRYSVPDVGEKAPNLGGIVIRVTEVQSHEDDPDFAVVTQVLEDYHEHPKYVTHLINRSDGGWYFGEYTDSSIEAMKAHSNRVRTDHRADLHGPHEELAREEDAATQEPGPEPVVIRPLTDEEADAEGWTPDPHMVAIFREGGNALALDEDGNGWEGPVSRDGSVHTREMVRADQSGDYDRAAQRAMSVLQDQR